MNTSTKATQEAAEAICGALHRYQFQFLGESDGGASTWFMRGEHPKRIRIEVQRSALAPMVIVNVEWRNLFSKLRGRQTLQVDVRGSAGDVFQATEKAVLRCLEIFRDVVSEEGVAGPLPAHNPIESTAESNVPETAEEERDADL
jgi:hypothetical protein